MKLFGLIGYPLSHSFSKQYFNKKFENKHIHATYKLFELDCIQAFTELNSKYQFSGLNVTIPYKEKIIPYLDELDDTAHKIGAVNVIQFFKKNGQRKLKGYNSDAIGFQNSITPFLKKHHQKALVLGSGGASKAIQYALKQLGLVTQVVSRIQNESAISYDNLDERLLKEHTVIINTTPLGMYPNTNACPNIPYKYLTKKHLLFDAIYNPSKTLFMQKGIEYGATVVNGEEMLIGQAEAAWAIWDKEE